MGIQSHKHFMGDCYKQGLTLCGLVSLFIREKLLDSPSKDALLSGGEVAPKSFTSHPEGLSLR